jgi:hypothetical protein
VISLHTRSDKRLNIVQARTVAVIVVGGVYSISLALHGLSQSTQDILPLYLSQFLKHVHESAL